MKPEELERLGSPLFVAMMKARLKSNPDLAADAIAYVFGVFLRRNKIGDFLQGPGIQRVQFQQRIIAAVQMGYDQADHWNLKSSGIDSPTENIDCSVLDLSSGKKL